MPQVRTTAEFSSTITADLTWRFREISDLRAAVRRIDEEFRRSLLRASVCIRALGRARVGRREVVSGVPCAPEAQVFDT